mmetsp:Transcript_97684/g.232539  ORF Transcript_97684/g.232539 Transcript_97684/m.232539 type:complete len:360 (+) Transcript_97684:67-1146(+)
MTPTPTITVSVKSPEAENPLFLSPKSSQPGKDIMEPDADVLRQISAFSETGGRQISTFSEPLLGGRQLSALSGLSSLSSEGLQLELEEVRRQLSEAQELAEQERRRAALFEERVRNEEKEKEHKTRKARQLIEETQRKMRFQSVKNGFQEGSPHKVEGPARALKAKGCASPTQGGHMMLPPTGKHAHRLSPSPKGIKTIFKGKHEREASRVRREEELHAMQSAAEQRKRDLAEVVKQADQQRQHEREMESRLLHALTAKRDLEEKNASLEATVERLSFEREDLLSRFNGGDSETVQSVPNVTHIASKKGRSSDMHKVRRFSGVIFLALLGVAASAWHLTRDTRRMDFREKPQTRAWLRR